MLLQCCFIGVEGHPDADSNRFASLYYPGPWFRSVTLTHLANVTERDRIIKILADFGSGRNEDLLHLTQRAALQTSSVSPQQ